MPKTWRDATPDEALRMIAEGERLPCWECHKVHRPAQKPGMAPQWYAPDGHEYREMTPQAFATFFLVSDD